MKKFMKSFVLVAVAAMALASCQKNELVGPKQLHFTINAGIETKTLLTDNEDGTYTPSWNKGDKIGLFFTEPNAEGATVVTFENKNENGLTASFEGTADVEGEGTFYSFYPRSAYNKAYEEGTVRFDLSGSQKPTATSYDPACDILVAKPCEYAADGETVVIDDLYFARLMSILKINLNSTFVAGEKVESISFAAKNVDIYGNAKVDLQTAEIVEWANGNTKRTEITATYTAEDYITIAGENNAAYLVVAPVTIPAQTELTFTLKTKNYNITKTVNAPKDMSFPAGNIAVINLTIAEENCEAIEDETRIWVEGFDGETTNKTQTTAANSGAVGTGVTENLTYTYSEKNCNVRINSNGQTSTNPYLYINTANSSFTASKIKIANENNLAFSAMVKGDGLQLTVQYKESSESSWKPAGVINGTSGFASGKVIFNVSNTATSIDVKLTGSGVMYVDDIVLESTEEEIPEVTLSLIEVTGQTTDFTEGESFKFDGTVTATYSDGSTKTVTPTSISTPDMTAGSHEVTVTYTEGGVTKEDTYTIIVNPTGGNEGGGTSGVVVLSEEFDNSTKSDSSNAINNTKFSNFSGNTSKAYTSKYGGIKLGSTSATGFITSKSLDLSSAFTVQIDACKYGTDNGNILVTVGSVTKTINNSELGDAGSFKTFTLSFDAATANSTVKIATSAKRAYIDNVIITKN